jgi:Cdc6-like AAA superfamily ATPase
MALFFDHFDPADVKPKQMIGRAREVHWLRETLARYLQTADAGSGRAVCLTGEKGIGKSILTRTVLDELKTQFAANTLFLVVDCRSVHSRRGVISAIAHEIVRELSSLMRASAQVPDALLATAQLLRALTRLDQVSLRVAHEQTLQYQTATRSKSRKAIASLKLNFGLSLELNEKQIKSLMGGVRFDDQGLTDALVALCHDLRALGFGVVLFLDNMDELRHEYRDENSRAVVRHDVEGVLTLKQAPIGLVLNMRSYYTGVIPREISNTRVLRPLAATDLMEILDRRMAHERRAVQEAMRTARPVAERLAGVAPTPLAFLRWVKFLFEEGMLHHDRLEEGFGFYLETQYANIEQSALQAVVQALPTPTSPIEKSAVLAACGGSQAVFETLQDRQVIMPDDFWHPSFGLFDGAP